MACSEPVRTIWGTNQVTNTVKYMTTIVELRQTITSEVEGTTVITSLIPQRTIFGTCSPEPSRPPSPGPSSSATSTLQEPESTEVASSAISSSRSSSSEQTSHALSSSFSKSAGTSSLSSKNEGRIITFTKPLASETLSGGMSSSLQSASTALPAASEARVSSPQSLIIGAAVGVSIVALILLVLLCLWRKRRREREEDDERDYWSGQKDDKEDYWERRFQALEAGHTSSKDLRQDGAGEEDAEVRKIRASTFLAPFFSTDLKLTLDLHSKKLNTRASRLSSLSAFLLPMVTPKAGATPFKRDRGSRLNFSRPLGPSPSMSSSQPKSPKSPRSPLAQSASRSPSITRKSPSLRVSTRSKRSHDHEPGSSFGPRSSRRSLYPPPRHSRARPPNLKLNETLEGVSIFSPPSTAASEAFGFGGIDHPFGGAETSLTTSHSDGSSCSLTTATLPISPSEDHCFSLHSDPRERSCSCSCSRSAVTPQLPTFPPMLPFMSMSMSEWECERQESHYHTVHADDRHGRLKAV